MVRRVLPLLCFAMISLCFVSGMFGQSEAKLPKVHLKSYHPAPSGMSQERLATAFGAAVSPTAKTAPVDPIQFTHWTFQVKSSRDGNSYPGVMVGTKALDGGSAASNVPVEIVPVIVKTVALGTNVDLNTGAITIATGAQGDKTTFNPTRSDDSCLASPNDVPANVLKQSPLFQAAEFNFGGVDVGSTQATDAFQRANFWNTIDRNSYHVLLAPLHLLSPVTLNAPAPSGGVGGLALDLPNLIPGICGRLGLVDINTIDSFVTSQFASLLAQGVKPSNFPIFMFYNTAFSIGDPANLGNCCAGGYHNAVNVNTNANPVAQTYSVIDFDMTGFFLNNSGSSVLDIEIASHEVAEWMDDPLGVNPVPAWGNAGQVQGQCQTNLEVGDPLSGTEAPRIFMGNSFTYHLQELAFFSWFFGRVNGGSHSIGVNHWFSNNGTFLTDAGPVCVPPA